MNTVPNLINRVGGRLHKNLINICLILFLILGVFVISYYVKNNKKILKSGQRISWIIKAKDKGIIQFYDREIDKIWTIKE